jgi:hypothetical protein
MKGAVPWTVLALAAFWFWYVYRYHNGKHLRAWKAVKRQVRSLNILSKISQLPQIVRENKRVALYVGLALIVVLAGGAWFVRDALSPKDVTLTGQDVVTQERFNQNYVLPFNEEVPFEDLCGGRVPVIALWQHTAEQGARLELTPEEHDTDVRILALGKDATCAWTFHFYFYPKPK